MHCQYTRFDKGSLVFCWIQIWK